MAARPTIYLLKCGQMQYLPAWNLQKQLASDVLLQVKKNEIPRHRLIILEHYPVYTIGIRTGGYSLPIQEKLMSLGAEFHRTNRGGLITFHGPGQLVAYPILHLPNLGQGIRWYVSALEQTVIKCCEQFSIQARTTSDTGIWINDRKICAIGIQGRSVTTHGLALNCNTDLGWFDHIVPCGIEGKSVTSVSRELNCDKSIEEVLPKFLKAFSHTFNVNIVNDEEENYHS